MRIAALPTDRFPSDGKAKSAFANPSLRSVLASSTPSFYSAITKAISGSSELSVGDQVLVGGCG